MTSDHNSSILKIQDNDNEPLSSTPILNVSPPADTSAPSLQSVTKSSSLTDNSKQQVTQPTSNVQPTTEPKTPTTNINAEENNTNEATDAQFQPYEFFNPFSTPIQETENHPLEKIHGNPSKPVQTRRQLATDPEMCMFALTVSITEPKNIKEEMADSAWIEAMQDELHQFDRLQVWELIDKPFGKTVIKLKWLWKNKKDEDHIVIRNKARLIAKICSGRRY
ncbi:hypothetical protein Tco_0881094 [Tanacetum coccineum]